MEAHNYVNKCVFIVAIGNKYFKLLNSFLNIELCLVHHTKIPAVISDFANKLPL